MCFFFFFFQAEDGIRDLYVTGVQTCALPILQLLQQPLYLKAIHHRLSLASGVSEHRADVRADEPVGRGRIWNQSPHAIEKMRSEERRVGKECKSRRATYQ